jgi:hypothetical protein
LWQNSQLTRFLFSLVAVITSLPVCDPSSVPKVRDFINNCGYAVSGSSGSSQKKSRGCLAQATRLSLKKRPVAFRPRLATGLAFDYDYTLKYPKIDCQ